MKRRITYWSQAWEDMLEWKQNDRAIFKKILKLIKNIERTPFEGLGKPKSLKYEWQGFYPHQINDEHRLIYTIEAKTLLSLNVRSITISNLGPKLHKFI